MLFITLTESKKSIIEDAKNRGFGIKKINFFDLSPGSNFFEENEQYDIFPSGQVEQAPISKKILNKIKTLNPDRIFFDGLDQLKYLSNDSFQYRKKILSFLQLASNTGATILLSSEVSENISDDDLQFLVDGVFNLEYKNENRIINITKFRGSNFEKGKHSFKLNEKGMVVFPILKPEKHIKKHNTFKNSSGIQEIDELLNGGIEGGTTTVITGPSGVGKTTLSMQFMKAASENGQRSVVYSFEETSETLIKRSESVNIPLREMKNNEILKIKKVDPLEYTPNEFSLEVIDEVENNNAKIVLIDSLAGYRLSFGENKNIHIVKSLHALSNYLNNLNVTVIIINEVRDITGNFRATDYGISYMADNIIFLRYLETQGKLKKAIGVLKKRLSDFEKYLREFKITNEGIKVGEPLKGLQGVLSGSPKIVECKENEIKE